MTGCGLGEGVRLFVCGGDLTGVVRVWEGVWLRAGVVLTVVLCAGTCCGVSGMVVFRVLLTGGNSCVVGSW